jgi:hypothetical protein
MEAHTMRPLTASPLNRTWLRITGRDRWTPATASVFSREWNSKAPSDNSVGQWHVVYEYAVANKQYIGRFVDLASGDEGCLRPGDRFEIRYNPRKPSQSYYPELQTQTYFLVVCVVMGALLAILMLFVSFGGRIRLTR